MALVTLCFGRSQLRELAQQGSSARVSHAVPLGPEWSHDAGFSLLQLYESGDVRSVHECKSVALQTDCPTAPGVLSGPFWTKLSSPCARFSLDILQGMQSLPDAITQTPSALDSQVSLEGKAVCHFDSAKNDADSLSQMSLNPVGPKRWLSPFLHPMQEVTCISNLNSVAHWPTPWRLHNTGSTRWLAHYGDSHYRQV